MELVAKESLRIVHVEDEDEFAQLTDIFLKRAGFQQPIKRFPCGEEALSHLSKIEPVHAPHVILLDHDMLGVSGLEALLWLRKNYSEHDVAIYLLTSADDSEGIRQAANAGVTKYFLKTGLFNELVQELDHLIAIRNHRCLEEIRKMREIMTELALIAEFVDEMVILTDAEGRIEWVNEPFVRTCGYTLKELHGTKPDRLWQGPESDPAAVEMLHQAIHSVRPCECRTVNYKRNGKTHPVHISLGPVLTKGKHEGFLAVEKDLSEEGE
jgi:PAS domain S-box-containing protein